MQHWYTVHTKPRQEETAEVNLQRQGFQVYLPRIQLARHKQGRWRDCIEPLFPRYLFIQADCDTVNLAPVRSTRGVSGLVRFGHKMIAVPDEIIAGLQELEDPQAGLVVPASPHFQCNDPVTILHGPFAQMQGIFQGTKGEERALILLECLGQLSTVTVSKHNLAHAS
jgi:transcriptional antiterminator RfaH